MTEVHVNNPQTTERVVVTPPTEHIVVTPPVERVVVEPDRSDRTSAAAINFLTVLIVLVAVIAILWFLFSGPMQAALYPAPPTNIQVNPRP